MTKEMETLTDEPLNPVVLSAIAARLPAIAVEMGFTLKRTSRSLYVKDGEDFCAAVVGVDGLVLGAPDTVGSTLLTLVDVTAAIEAVGGLGPGDVLITNDSFTSGALSSHLADIHVVQPYYCEDTLVGYGWAFIHSSDVGGRVPSSISPLNTDVFQEGLQIPPVKFVKNGEIDPEIERIMRQNSRTPDANSSDIRAMLAALRHGQQAVAGLVDKYGLGAYLAAGGQILQRSAEKSRALARQLPAGPFEFSDFLDDDGLTPYPVRFKVRVGVRADGDFDIDFTGTDPQVASAFNIATAGRSNPMTTGRIRSTLSTLDPDFPTDGGQLRALHVTEPAGTVVHAQRPAAVGARHVSGVRLSDVLGGALFQAAPGVLPAAGSGVVVPVVVAERTAAGYGSQVAMTLYGGFGAAEGLDGHDGRDNSYSIVPPSPVEATEAALDVDVVRYGLRCDSGGAGRYRGGAGLEFVLRIKADHTRVLARGLDRFVFRPWGVLGGRPGLPMEVLVDAGTREERRLQKFDFLELRAGQTVTFRTPGGGGYGSALQRPIADVAHDVELGLVSVAAARAEYGVVLDVDGVTGLVTVDEDMTAQCRDEAGRANAAAQPAGAPAADEGAALIGGADGGAVELFDFGPERRAWDTVFPSAWYDDFNRTLMELPVELRRSERARVFARALAGLPEGFPRIPAEPAALQAAAAEARAGLAELTELRSA